ncbi:uncharacterized protein LOC124112831 [Haliotis rufescens]|uniref:uncharacterized protein LOC124112831 n=1 Tax=Haliotis rufescens TaxID=6454 RepID=UPI00201FA5D6|nr:uncharacterized protein LOC124112831 [Haliotis rufescens]
MEALLTPAQRVEVTPQAKQLGSYTAKTKRRSGRKRALSETAIEVEKDFGVIAVTTSDPPPILEDNSTTPQTVSTHKRKKYRRHSHAGKMETLALTEEQKSPAKTTLHQSPSSTHKPERTVGSGRVYGKHTEDKIVVYVWERRDLELPLSGNQLQEYARQVVGGNFKASKSWLRRFLARNELTLPGSLEDSE